MLHNQSQQHKRSATFSSCKLDDHWRLAGKAAEVGDASKNLQIENGKKHQDFQKLSPISHEICQLQITFAATKNARPHLCWSDSLTAVINERAKFLQDSLLAMHE